MTLAKRQAFTLIKKAYEKINRKPVTTPSTLRLIVPLTANRTSFTFPILEGDSNLQHPNQILLNRADAFTATQMGVFVGGIEYAVGMSGVKTLTSIPVGANRLGNEIISGDAVLLSNAQFSSNFDPFALLDNSLLNISVNNVKYLQNFDLLSTSKNTSLGVTNTAGQQNTINFANNTNGNYGERDGFVDLVPTLQFSGTSKVDITLNCPSAPLPTANIDQLYIEVIFRGFLSLGASNLNK
jgi:hypothetical protein